MMTTSDWSAENTLGVVMGILGGLGLFLLGINMLSQGVRNLAGRQMRHLLTYVSGNRVAGVAFGVFFTMLFQSSSAATVVLVGFVEAGLLQFAQTLPVVLGTAFGTTITAQLIAFKVGAFALLAVGLGLLASMFTRGKWKFSFETLLSLGLIFYGMDLMSGAMRPLQQYAPFLQLITHIQHPVLALLLGMLGTAVIQSSAAFIGILITLGSTGLLSVEASLPLVLGSNIGTTVTGLISAMNVGRPAQKVALSNFLFKLFTAIVFVFMLPWWAFLTDWITGTRGEYGRWVANAHTLFNLVLMLAWLPFTGWFGRWMDRWVLPTPQRHEFALKFLTDEVLDSPDLSTGLLKKELLMMGQVVLRMVDVSLSLFQRPPQFTPSMIREMEEETDHYRQKINDFWLKSARVSQREKWPPEVFQLLHLMNELEQIADLVSVNLVHQAEKWEQSQWQFSSEGRKELEHYHAQCVHQLQRALDLVENRDYNRALQMKQKYREYAYLAFDLEKHHYQRLFSLNAQTMESSKIHLELLNLYRMINSRATNFGRIILREAQLPTDLNNGMI
ncbi:MAG: Na/Pi cotransporter family protein [Marinilabiliaceae bacterium]|nr:Na/Pi cotransporter family protein [Marinilabiliaceae bacterium]